MISKKILNFVKRKKNGFKDDFTLLRLERMKMWFGRQIFNTSNTQTIFRNQNQNLFKYTFTY